MKNKKVLGALLAASFCASTMTACGVYGAPEEYEEINVTETEETDTVISKEKEDDGKENVNNGTETENDDTEYCPDKEQETCVYGPPEDFE